MNNQVKQKTQKGFTLIELLVVIAIIGLLASVVLVALGNARSKSRDAKRVADIRQVTGALELYFNDCNSYPVSATSTTTGTTLGTASQGLYLGTAASCGTNLGTTGANGGIGTTPGGTVLISQMPTAPSPADGTCDATTNAYTYRSTNATGTAVNTGPAAGFRINFCLGAATGGLVAGTASATQNGTVQPAL